MPALAIPLLLLAVLQALPPRDAVRPRPAAAGTASVSGRGYSAVSGAPVRGAVVALAAGPLEDVMTPRARFEAAKAGATTDEDGRFRLSGVPAGTYYVIAMPSTSSGRHLPAGYAARTANDPGRTVAVAEGADVRGVDIALPPALAIEGRVVDELGEPLARVWIFAGRYSAGSDVPQRVGPTGMFGIQTDDLGHYRLYGLEPGTYVVAADGRSSVNFVESDGRTFIASIAQRDAVPFAVTFHPSTTDESAAQRVRLSGQDVTGIDITLLRSRRLQLSGMLLDSRGQSAVFTTVLLARRGLALLETRTTQTDPLGQFHIGGLEPGDYRLLVGSGMAPGLGSVNGRTEFAEVPVTIADDVSGLTVTTQPGIGLAGQVVFAEAPPAKAPAMTIALRRPEEWIPRAEGIQTTMDGALRFYASDVFGAYLIRVTGLQRGWAVKAVTLAGVDITDVPTAFTPEHEGRLHVVLSSRVATLEGHVRADEAAPAGDATVFVFAEERTSWRMSSPRTRAIDAGENGRFQVPDHAPGRYSAVAVAKEGFRVPPRAGVAFFELLSQAATPFVVGEDERRTLDLKAFRWPE